METETRIKNLLGLTLNDPNHKDEINFLMGEFKITKEQLLASWLYWDTSIRKYSNEVYSSKALRLVMHLHNYLKDSWHEKRQECVLGYLNKIMPKSICEIGFGTPQKYVKKYLEKDVKIILGDYEQSSLQFAEKLISRWSSYWKQKVDLTIFDLNKDNLPTDYTVYIFQDSIEHADNPSKALKKYVEGVLSGTHFIFSLPIEVGNPIPEHHIFWKDKDEVLSWLAECGLEVIDNTVIKMNKEVDLYSLSLHPDFSELVVLARKN